MNAKSQYRAYAAATQTVARTQQIVMLYDGVLRFMQRAKDAIQQGRIEERYKMLMKATDVIMGLQGCLDFEKGGEMAKLLYNFYSTVDARIFSIHRTNSIETCEEIIAELKKMRDVWNEIDQGSADAPATAPAPAPAAQGATPSTPDQSVILSA